MFHWPRPGEARLFLAITVVVHHSTRLYLGPWAVFCFFVLSGYWIARMWHGKYLDTVRPMTIFWSSRLIRLVPMFWLANLMSIAVGLLQYDLATSLARLSTLDLLQWIGVNLIPLGYSSLPLNLKPLLVAWSLDVEIQFYLVAPITLWLLSRRKLGGLFALILALLALVGWLRFTFSAEATKLPLQNYGLFFLIGVMASRLNYKPSNTIAGVSLGLTVAIVAGSLFGPPMLKSLFLNALHADGALAGAQIPVQSLLAIVAVPFLLHTVHQPSHERDAMFGEMAYLIYLFHWPVLAVYSYHYGALPVLQRLPYFLAAWTITFSLSLTLYKMCDRPLERWRKLWVLGARRHNTAEVISAKSTHQITTYVGH